MNKKKWLAILAIILLLLLWLWSTRQQSEEALTTAATPASETLDAATLPDQLLLDLRDDASVDEVRQLAGRYGLDLRLNSIYAEQARLYRTSLAQGKVKRGWRELLAKLRQEPLVERAEPDQLYGIPPLEQQATRFAATEPPPSGFPNDPKYRYQWHLDQIGMPAAWARGSGKGVIVAVIDTGVAYRDRGSFKRVPDLAQTEVVAGYDFVNDNDFPLDDHGHGTHVAGTIAQSTNNGIGVAGVAYRARIMPLKVLSARGFGSVADIADAIRFAADKGAKVINMSLGGSRSSKVLAAAVAYAVDKGVVVVCAAGNEGRDQVSYPAGYPGAVGVAATQFDRKTTFYSNWGKAIDVAAPGGNTRIDQNGDGMPDGVLQNTIVPGRPAENDYLLFMGTSMASPHVAGVAALVIESGVTDPKAVERVLKQTANHPQGKERDDRYGHGIVDAGAALQRTNVSWGAYRLGLAGGLALLLLGGLRRRGSLGIRLGPGLLSGLVLGAAGLFFLPRPGWGGEAVGLVHGLLSQGLLSWDTVLLGIGGHATPLVFSVLPPLGLTALFYGVSRLRGVLTGLTLGIAAHLLFGALATAVDVQWIPNLLGLDQLWLLCNGLACLGLAALLARR